MSDLPKSDKVDKSAAPHAAIINSAKAKAAGSMSPQLSLRPVDDAV
jgi:hypothetical protein